MFSLVSKLAMLFHLGQMELHKSEKGEGQPETCTLMSSFASNASLIAVTTFAVTPHFPTCKLSDTFLVGCSQLENHNSIYFGILQHLKSQTLNPRPTHDAALAHLFTKLTILHLLQLRSVHKELVGMTKSGSHQQRLKKKKKKKKKKYFLVRLESHS
jgi:hypothetical protein